VIAAIGDPTSSERELHPEEAMMQTQIQTAEVKADVSPLLRSIAVELRERTRDVRELETRQLVLQAERGAHAKEWSDIEARLSIHRRELRTAMRELERLDGSSRSSRL
jgi:hypothetical protein